MNGEQSGLSVDFFSFVFTVVALGFLCFDLVFRNSNSKVEEAYYFVSF